MITTNTRELWDKGIRLIQYPDGRRYELRMNSAEVVYECLVETAEEARIREISTLQRRIKADMDRLRELTGGWYDY